jgi:hypothetical protein
MVPPIHPGQTGHVPREIEYIRVGDREREDVVAFLSRQVGDGTLSLEEFSDRLGRVLVAATSAELAVEVADLPGAVQLFRPGPAGASRRWRVRLSIFGRNHQSEGWTPATNTVAIAVFGSLSLDLREMPINEQQLAIHAFAVFGTVNVTAPVGVELDCSAVSVFGAVRGSVWPADGQRPVLLRVDGAAIFGTIAARQRPSRARTGLDRLLRRRSSA